MTYQVRRINAVDWTAELFTELVNIEHLYDEIQKRIISYDEKTGCMLVEADTVGEPRTMRWQVKGKMKSVNVYKIVFVLAYDFIYPEPICRHLCGNRLCVNENHLWVGDDQDNKLDDKFHAEFGKGQCAPRDWVKIGARETISTASVIETYFSNEWLQMKAEQRNEILAISDSRHFGY